MKFWRPVSCAALVPFIALVVAGAQESAVPEIPEAADLDTSVILIVLDNSASLPPLDPQQKRQTALEKMLAFLEGQRYRLILFGGRNEIFLDSPERYSNRGQWTDFYFAFERARRVAASYPKGTDVKMVLITDGVNDPSPADWEDQDVPEGGDLKQFASQRVIQLLEEMQFPLYVMEIGTEVSSDFIEEMVQAANGPLVGNRYAQGVTEFLQDDGVVLRRFIYRVEPGTGLEVIEPIVRRIATPPAYRTEMIILSVVFLLAGTALSYGVRSFPGPGDQEVIELRAGQPVHIAVDRLRTLPLNAPKTDWLGLSFVESATQAAASLNLIGASENVPPDGYDLERLSGPAKQLVRLPLPELQRKLAELAKSDDKDTKVEALNLEYAGSGFDSQKAEEILASSTQERRMLDPREFLYAKIHLLYNPLLCSQFTSPRVRCNIYGAKARKWDLRAGTRVRLGRYLFRVKELAPGGRKDYIIKLVYQRTPSVLWLKSLIPTYVQKIIRLRRSRERIVN